MTKKIKTCSICELTFTEFGNNAWPVNGGRCCDACNVGVVLPVRFDAFAERKQPEKFARAEAARLRAMANFYENQVRAAE